VGAKKLNIRTLEGLPEEFQDIIPTLKEFPIFEDFADPDMSLSSLINYMTAISFPVGSKILTEGLTNDSMYFLLKGSVEILKTTDSGDSFLVAEVNASSYPYFGEGGILDSHERSVTIVAAEQVLCLSLQRVDFEQYCEEYPQYGLPILRFIARRTARRLRKVGSDFVFLYHAYVTEIRGSK